MDIFDKKFAVIAFIAGLGVQLKDLMFSISKNPQGSMTKVLAKIEKYIKGEEAFLSKQKRKQQVASLHLFHRHQHGLPKG